MGLYIFADVTWCLYPYYDIENPEIYNWNIHLKPNSEEYQYQHTFMATLTFGMYVS